MSPNLSTPWEWEGGMVLLAGWSCCCGKAGWSHWRESIANTVRVEPPSCWGLNPNLLTSTVNDMPLCRLW